MRDVLIARFETSNTYRGHSSINRYHWEVGFECFKIDRSEERKMGILVNGEPLQDTFEIVFLNYKNIGIRREVFKSASEANDLVKKYMMRGFKRV